ncbi:glycosyl transferase [Acidovorax carolinensis]|uniref:Glycosyl transferase n=1 Tax=Acidovorax carolinensis TaxID=553814 RepID=A0A240TYE7_9BURK|nr:glycosyltransferase family 39 protein [Acidovorax carolinensis]ART50625.1 glycosyl transferase [Acidovorax carolinensis]
MTAPTAPRAFSSGPVWAHPLFWLAFFAFAHIAVRVAVSPALKWDEAEQMLWTQQLSMGYGSQPPLYTWLQWLVNQVLGPSVLSLSVLKHSLLAMTYAFMYLAAREVLDERGAFWASASMLLMPPLGWYSVRDQTHTVLVTAMVCAAWWLLLRIARKPRSLDFALLGLVCGLGMLAKYSFAMVAVAMLVAALSVRTTRSALLSRGWWWAPFIGLLVVLPHAVWLFSHLHEATAETIGKMNIQPEVGRAQGFLSLIDGVAASLLLWVLIALWAFRAHWWRTPVAPASPAIHQMLLRFLMLVMLTLAGMVLFAGVTSFKGRWILPLLCVAPLVAFAARPQLQQDPRAGRYSVAIFGMAVILLVAAGVRPWFSGLRGEVDELNHPAVELAQELRTAGYDGLGTIVASDHMLAGMLRVRFPQALVDACMSAKNSVPQCVADHAERSRQAGKGLLLVSRADRIAPDWWEQALSRVAPQPVRSIDLPFHMVREGTPAAHYGYVWYAPK